MISEVPVVPAVTRPLDEPILATERLLLLHVPLGTASESVVVVPPPHRMKVPVMGDIGFTVKPWVAKHPEPEVMYEITVVPPLTPVTVPVVEPIVATDVTVLLQVPPDVPSDKVVELVPQTLNVPVIGDTAGLTVTVVVPVAVQPEPDAVAVTVYVPLMEVVTLLKVGF